MEENSKDDKGNIKQQRYHHCPEQLFSAKNVFSDVPHHLKSKAANVDSVSKAARILAIAMFTVFERSVCTISGTTAKNASPEPGKASKQKFDEHRLTLIQGNCSIY